MNLFAERGAGQDLRGTSLRGGTLTLASQVIRLVVTLVGTMVLARILSPEDYGLTAMVLPIVGFIMLFSNLGFAAATIQRKRIDESLVSTLFWLSLGVGVALGGALVIGSPLIAGFYAEPRVRDIAVALAAVFVVDALAVQHRALLTRAMRFSNLAISDVGSATLGTLAAIVTALNGGGYWSLVVLVLATQIGHLGFVWALSRWLPGRPHWTRDVRSSVMLGGNLTGFNIVNFFGRNADNVLIGWRHTGEELGYYSVAYRLLLLPMQNINAPVAAVAVPVLSRLQDDPARFERYYTMALKLLGFASFPVIVFLFFMAEPVIVLMLGDKWLPAVGVFRVLALTSLLQASYTTVGWLYLATGRTDRLFKWALIFNPVVLVGFLIGLPWGAMGVAVAYTVTNAVMAVPTFAFALSTAPVRGASVVRALREPAGLGAVVAAVLGAYTFALPELARGAVGLVLAASLSVVSATVFFVALLGTVRLKSRLRELYDTFKSGAVK